MLAGGSFTSGSYRDKFDISLPVYNSLTRHLYTDSSNGERQAVEVHVQLERGE